VPSTTPSTSLGTSVLPSSTSSALRRAVRTGRLEGKQLVGNVPSSDEDDSEQVDEAFMDALRRGDVTNAGAAAKNADALVAALESAYGQQQKDSKFKIVRTAAPPRTLAEDEGPREGSTAPRLLPTSETVFERKRPAIIIDSPPPQAGVDAAIVDSPSFPSTRRPTRPPTVLPTSGLVRESPGGGGAAPSPGPGRKMSRFKAQQTESG
jgi:hypothetical protein